MKAFKKITSVIVALTLIFATVPEAVLTEAEAAVDSGQKVTDYSTMDSWQNYFGTSDSNFSTRYEGHVWTDKSVHTSASAFSYAKELAGNTSTIALNRSNPNNFLVSLSAMTASESIEGRANKPTDTMIVLDLSSSMYDGSSRTTATVKSMVDSVNSTIRQLQELNVNNRVGVTVYYGGPDRNQSTAPSYMLLLPLDRYNHTSGKYLRYTTSGSRLQTVGVNTNVTNSKNVAVSGSRTVTDVAGTYTQQGILSAMQQFLNADTTVPTTAAVDSGSNRTPVMVLMSDGEPTAATHNYTNINADAGMGNNTVSIRYPNQTDFVTQLTAAYAKEMMDAHYEETPLFYTLSLGTSISYDVMDPSDTLGKNFTPSSTISGYWDKLIQNGSVKITVKNSPNAWADATVTKNYTVSRTTITGKSLTKNKAFPSSKTQQRYVDRAFEAATAKELDDAFASIVTDIKLQTHTYPTLVEGDGNQDGYVSFVDRIGRYMHVADMKGIIIGDTWYSGKELAKSFASNGGNPADEMVSSVQKRLGISNYAAAQTLISLACEHGQLSYDSGTGAFSNYIGWYADADGKYEGFWHEGSTTKPANAEFAVKSYGYLGETDRYHGVKDSDLMYATVQVRTHLTTGEELVTFAVPAALIPSVEYNVKLDVDGKVESLTRDGAEKPIRLVYEVALNPEINGITVQDSSVVDADYVAAHSDADGNVYFYTNQYETDGTMGYNKVNTYSYFRPAHDNDNYYYSSDAVIYKDTSGTPYTGSKPSASGAYYRKVESYAKNGSRIITESAYVQIAPGVLEAAEKGSGNTWYIPKDTVFVNVQEYNLAKSSNLTGTLPNANAPYVDVYGHSPSDADHRFVVGDTLGNNGKLTLKAASGLKLTKHIKGETASAEDFRFTISGGTANGRYEATRVNAAGKATMEFVNFTSGNAEVTLKAEETLYIAGLAAGTAYEITEAESAGYLLSGIQVDGTDAAGTSASVTVEENNIHHVEFTNVPRGTGALTVAKVIEYASGSGETDHTDKVFTIQVKLDGIAVKDGDTFELKHSDETQPKNVTIGADKTVTLTLKDGQQAEILGIPEGTKAVVNETNPGAGFTAKYAVNGVSGQNEVTIVKAPAIDTITVTNTYQPSAAKVKIDLSGTKTLLDQDGKVLTVDKWPDNVDFEFVIQKFENGKWVNIKKTVLNNQSSGNNIDFEFDEEELTFDKAGIYGYQVIEKNHGLTVDGITYDATMHTFDVVVTDDGAGHLKAEVVSSHGTGENSGFTQKPDGTWVNNKIDFTNVNRQTDTSVLIMVKKLLENTSGSEKVNLEGYQFELYECNEDFSFKNPSDPETTEKTDISGETYVSLEYEYADQGTYYYQLKEKATGINGMEDSAEYYSFKVEVAKDPIDNSKITATVISVVDLDENTQDKSLDTFTSGTTGEGKPPISYPLAVFTNKYSPAAASLELDVRKALDGRPLQAGEFVFQLKQGETVLQTKDNGVGGDVQKVPFEALSFSQVGNYTYTVSEVKPQDNAVKDVTYDETVYELVVTVTDPGTGTLQAHLEVLNVPGNQIVFENVYRSSEPVSIEVSGNKTFTNWKGESMEMTNDQFVFILQECDASGNLVAEGFKTSARNNVDGSFAFQPLSYDTTGTRYYAVYEYVPAETWGVQYDTAKYLVTAVVTYNAEEGKLEVNHTITESGTDAAIQFENRYVPAAAEVTVPAMKNLEGKTLTEGMFQFTMTETDDSWNKADGAAPIATASNDAEGIIRLTLPEYKDEGIHYYVLEETNSGQTGFTYDPTTYGITVTVTDNERGQFVAEVHYVDLVNQSPAGAATFTNYYEAVPTTFDFVVSKNLQDNGPVQEGAAGGMTLTAGQFEFRLTGFDGAPMPATNTASNGEDGSVTFGQVTYEMEGTYHYKIQEISGGLDINGIAYDPAVYLVDVTVTDNAGQLSASAVYTEAGSGEGSSAAFTNVYDPGKVSLTLMGKKKMTGRELDPKDIFTFEMVQNTVTVNPEDGSETPAEVPVGTVTSLRDGTIILPTLTFQEVGVYSYTIRENAGFIPGVTYDENEYYVTIETVMNGEILEASVSIADKDGILTGAGYTDPDQTPIVFLNEYKPAGTSVIIEANKVLSGRTLQTGDFTFELRDSTGNLIDTAKNEAAALNGRIRFDAIEFSLDGTMGIGRHVFTVNEVNEGLGGITYDETVLEVVIDVEDNPQTGRLQASVITKDAEGMEVKTEVADGGTAAAGTFTNIYGDGTAAAYLNLQVLKVLDGRELRDGEFTFILTGSDGAPMPEEATAVNTAAGLVKFGAIKFEQPGEFTYTITEFVPDEAVGGAYRGVTYNSNGQEYTSYTINVTVTDGGDGQPLQVAIGGNIITQAYHAGSFYNSYQADGTAELIITARKTLNGRTLQDGEFTFQLKDQAGNLVDTRTNTADGSITFAPVYYSAADAGRTFTYTVHEVKGNLSYVTYDTTVKTVTVNVVDNGDGTVAAYDAAHPQMPAGTAYAGEFVNLYEYPEVPDIPDIPDVPDVPDIPDVPEIPEDPEVPETPPTPGEPEEPGTPFEPEEPETPMVPEEPEPGVPKTGDETNITLWLLLLAVSGMGLTGNFLSRKKK